MPPQEWIPILTDLRNVANPVPPGRSLFPSGLRVHDALLGGRQGWYEEKTYRIQLLPQVFGICGFATQS